jgi:uncharacterized membrane protein (TIGR02234 family)
MTAARRELVVAVLLCLVGSGLVLFAVSRSWGHLSTPHELTIKRVGFSAPGSRIAGDVQALGVLGIAGVLAIAATKRTGRVVVGALVALAGVVVVVRVAYLLADGIGPRLCTDTCGSGRRLESVTPFWPWATLVGGVVLAVAGLLVAVRGRSWAALSASYENPATRPAAEPEVTDKSVWDALDEGHDPTA